MTFYATLCVKGTAAFVMQWLYLCIDMNAKDTKMSLLHCTYNVFSFFFAAGALAHVEEGQEKAINKAVNEEEWNTAATLLEPVKKGMLSCSVCWDIS